MGKRREPKPGDRVTERDKNVTLFVRAVDPSRVMLSYSADSAIAVVPTIDDFHIFFDFVK